MPDPHRAEQVLQAWVTAITGLATTAARVHRGRTYALGAGEANALLVRQGEDVPVQDDSSSAVYTHIDRMLQVFTKVVVRDQEPDALINQIRKEITIAAMANGAKLGLAFVLNTIEGPAGEPRFRKDGNIRLAETDLLYRVIYRTSRTDPSA